MEFWQPWMISDCDRHDWCMIWPKRRTTAKIVIHQNVPTYKKNSISFDTHFKHFYTWMVWLRICKGARWKEIESALLEFYHKKKDWARANMKPTKKMVIHLFYRLCRDYMRYAKHSDMYNQMHVDLRDIHPITANNNSRLVFRSKLGWFYSNWKCC